MSLSVASLIVPLLCVFESCVLLSFDNLFHCWDFSSINLSIYLSVCVYVYLEIVYLNTLMYLKLWFSSSLHTCCLIIILGRGRAVIGPCVWRHARFRLRKKIRRWAALRPCLSLLTEQGLVGDKLMNQTGRRIALKLDLCGRFVFLV